MTNKISNSFSSKDFTDSKVSDSTNQTINQSAPTTVNSSRKTVSFASNEKIQKSIQELTNRGAFKTSDEEQNTEKIYGTKLITNFKHLGDVKYEKLSDITPKLNYDPAHLDDYLFKKTKQ